VRHAALRAGAAAPAQVRDALARMRALAAGLRGVRRIVHLGTGGSDLGARLLMDALGENARHEVRFAANLDPLDLARVPMWDWVGGRFSIWSAASFSALAALGPDAFEAFLAGGRDMDRHFLDAPPEKNVPALLALLGVWNVNFLGAATHCVLPYAHALKLLPAYLQQLEMESNGKRVDREGRALGYATAPVVWGAEGTVSQHSFHQLLHQGTQAVPADFIVAGVSAELDANAEAQARALAFGTADPALPAHRRYPGNRPSNTLRLERIDARALGALVAAYEHKVFVQGVIWNVNSFDQWGVELGKQMAGEILQHQRGA